MPTSSLFKAVALAAALSPAAGRADAQGALLPLDPLTAAEQAAGDTIARADPRIRDFVGGGPSRLINIGFISLKDGAAPVPGRGADVLYYRSDRDEGLRAVIDLGGRRVTEISTLPGTSVPLSGEEVVAAARLAQADPRVAQLFEGRVSQFRVATAPAMLGAADSARIEGLRLVGATPTDPCYRRRCVALFFRVNNRYVQMNRVVVDVTRKRVIVREAER